MNSSFPRLPADLARRCGVARGWAALATALTMIAGCHSRPAGDELTSAVERLGGKVVRTASPQPDPGLAVTAPSAASPVPIAAKSGDDSGGSQSAGSEKAAAPAPASPEAAAPPFPQSLEGAPPSEVHVDLSGTSVRDDDLAKIPGLEQATSLCIRGTAVTDRGLEQLAGATNLRTLDLRNTSVTDQGITQLQHLPKLNYVALDGCNVTQGGVDYLRSLLPPGAAVTFDRRWLK